MNENLIYSSMMHAAQQIVNSGAADPKEVKAFLEAQMDGLHDQSIAKQMELQKQEFLLPSFPDDMGTDGVLSTFQPNARTPKVIIPQGYELEGWQEAIISVGVGVIPVIGPLVTTTKIVAASTGRTIGIGPQISLGAGVGVSLSGGVVISDKGKFGGFGTIGGIVGALASISLTVQITIIGGGIEVFKGESWCAGVAGGEVLVGNIAALFSLTNPTRFIGVTIGIGLGLGIPMEVFVGAQNTWA